ncbi:hypothetical protein SEPCBS57363_006415 [Sporothrix epigloea]|uniref:Uncharacterized protein n=1 Tax=Sporothrix epigloea TaxID=1892477 RepID=A0ABP0E3C6_9PEZI
MLAARDQENRVFGHSLGGQAGKNHALGPKTPSGKNFKTPMKVALNDGNGTIRMAGKSVLGGRAGGNENMQTVGKGKNLVTPSEPRTARAPLGNKTTNAKAQAVQQAQQLQQQKSQAGGVKDIVRDIEQSQRQQQQQQRPMPQTGGRRPRAVTPGANSFKLSVLNDASVQADAEKKIEHEEDIEYAPPQVPARPYESDVFPKGVLTFAAFQPQNRLRGVYDYYYNPIDETDGVPLREKAFLEQQQQAFAALDRRVQEDVDSFDWSIGDVPASKEYFAKKGKQPQEKKASTPAPVPPPATIASRKAASALSVPSTRTNVPMSSRGALQTKAKHSLVPASSTSSASTSLLSGLPLRKPRAAPMTAMPLRFNSRGADVGHPVAEAASRTTLGYNKGRTALSLVRGNACTSSSTLPTACSTGTVKRAAPAKSSYDNGTITTVPCVQQQQPSLDELHGDNAGGLSVPRSPAFLSIFEIEEDEQDSFGGPETFVNDDLDDGFQMDTNF